MPLNPQISVVIPCKNEESHITRCLLAIVKQCPSEIHVIDNGSTDETVNLIKRFGESVKLHCAPGLNISELRNLGAAESNGNWIAFLDADVEVAHDWYRQVAQILEQLHKSGEDLEKVITGSTLDCPPDSTWIEQVWCTHLKAREGDRHHYINSGHLIISRTLFNQIGGFDTTYMTGEDVKLCADGRVFGATVVKALQVRAVHHGYPKTVRQFFMRESWHALGMLRRLGSFWRARDALLGGYYLIVILIILPVTIVVTNSIILAVCSSIAIGVFPLLVLALKRVDSSSQLIPLTILYAIYGIAKSRGLLAVLLNPNNPRLRHWKKLV